jgi:hypothetical protein
MPPKPEVPRPEKGRSVRAASFDAETVTALDQPKHKPGDPPPSSPHPDHALDADEGLVAAHNSMLSAAVRAAPVHDLLDTKKLRHLCEEVRAKSEAAAGAGGAGGAGGGAGGGPK